MISHGTLDLGGRGQSAQVGDSSWGVRGQPGETGPLCGDDPVGSRTAGEPLVCDFCLVRAFRWGVHVCATVTTGECATCGHREYELAEESIDKDNAMTALDRPEDLFDPHPDEDDDPLDDDFDDEDDAPVDEEDDE